MACPYKNFVEERKMVLPLDEIAVFEMMEKELYTPVVADILDQMGCREQTMAARIRPVYPSAVVVGRAMTMLGMEVYRVPEHPYRLCIEALDQVQPGEVPVITAGGAQSAAFWGELLSTATRARGGRGAIVDAYSRDVNHIIRMQFPVFATGIRPTDSLGRIDVVDYRVPVRCGDVLVNPGDIVFADYDGAVVLPQGIWRETVERALEKVRGENRVREELTQGALLGDVFRKHGIL
jgi:regulator of RNase E activity RraA